MSTTDPLLVQTARRLGEAGCILEGVETTALGCVAQMLAETAESLARTAKIREHYPTERGCSSLARSSTSG